MTTPLPPATCANCQSTPLPPILTLSDAHTCSQCGAVYDVEIISGGSAAWRLTGLSDLSTPRPGGVPTPAHPVGVGARVPDPVDPGPGAITRAELSAFLDSISTPTQEGGADILRAIRQRWALPFPNERVHVVLRVEIPGIDPAQSTPGLPMRVAEHLAHLPVDAIVKLIHNAEPEIR